MTSEGGDLKMDTDLDMVELTLRLFVKGAFIGSFKVKLHPSIRKFLNKLSVINMKWKLAESAAEKKYLQNVTDLSLEWELCQHDRYYNVCQLTMTRTSSHFSNMLTFLKDHVAVVKLDGGAVLLIMADNSLTCKLHLEPFNSSTCLHGVLITEKSRDNKGSPSSEEALSRVECPTANNTRDFTTDTTHNGFMFKLWPPVSSHLKLKTVRRLFEKQFQNYSDLLEQSFTSARTDDKYRSMRCVKDKKRELDNPSDVAHKAGNNKKTSCNKDEEDLCLPEKKRHKSENVVGSEPPPPVQEVNNNTVRKRHRTESSASSMVGEAMFAASRSPVEKVKRISHKFDTSTGVSDDKGSSREKTCSEFGRDTIEIKSISHKDSPKENSSLKSFDSVKGLENPIKSDSRPGISEKKPHKSHKEKILHKEEDVQKKKSIKETILSKLEATLMPGKEKEKSHRKLESKTSKHHKKHGSNSSSSKSSKSHKHLAVCSKQRDADQVFSSMFTGLTKELGRIPKKRKTTSENPLAAEGHSDCTQNEKSNTDKLPGIPETGVNHSHVSYRTDEDKTKLPVLPETGVTHSPISEKANKGKTKLPETPETRVTHIYISERKKEDKSMLPGTPETTENESPIADRTKNDSAKKDEPGPVLKHKHKREKKSKHGHKMEKIKSKSEMGKKIPKHIEKTTKCARKDSPNTINAERGENLDILENVRDITHIQSMVRDSLRGIDTNKTSLFESVLSEDTHTKIPGLGDLSDTDVMESSKKKMKRLVTILEDDFGITMENISLGCGSTLKMKLNSSELIKLYLFGERVLEPMSADCKLLYQCCLSINDEIKSAKTVFRYAGNDTKKKLYTMKLDNCLSLASQLLKSGQLEPDKLPSANQCPSHGKIDDITEKINKIVKNKGSVATAGEGKENSDKPIESSNPLYSLIPPCDDFSYSSEDEEISNITRSICNESVTLDGHYPSSDKVNDSIEYGPPLPPVPKEKVIDCAANKPADNSKDIDHAKPTDLSKELERNLSDQAFATNSVNNEIAKAITNEKFKDTSKKVITKESVDTSKKEIKPSDRYKVVDLCCPSSENSFKPIGAGKDVEPAAPESTQHDNKDAHQIYKPSPTAGLLTGTAVSRSCTPTNQVASGTTESRPNSSEKRKESTRQLPGLLIQRALLDVRKDYNERSASRPNSAQGMRELSPSKRRSSKDLSRSSSKDRSRRSGSKDRSSRSDSKDRSRRSGSKDRSSRSDSKDRSRRSGSKDRSSRSDSKDRSRRSGSGDTTSSKSRDRSRKRSPSCDRSECRERRSRSSDKKNRDSPAESIGKRLEKIAAMTVDSDKISGRSDKRKERQYHPYKKETRPRRPHVPYWSFDLAYSDMNELLQNMTVNSFKKLKLRPAEVGSRKNSLGRRRGRFSQYRFRRSDVYRTPPRETYTSSDDEEDMVRPDEIPELTERAKQADILEEKFMGDGDEEDEYSSELLIYEKEQADDRVVLCSKKGDLDHSLVIPGGPRTTTYSSLELTESNDATEELAFGSKEHQDKPDQSEKLSTLHDTYSNRIIKEHFFVLKAQHTPSKRIVQFTADSAEDNSLVKQKIIEKSPTKVIKERTIAMVKSGGETSTSKKNLSKLSSSESGVEKSITNRIVKDGSSVLHSEEIMSPDNKTVRDSSVAKEQSVDTSVAQNSECKKEVINAIEKEDTINTLPDDCNKKLDSEMESELRSERFVLETEKTTHHLNEDSLENIGIKKTKCTKEVKILSSDSSECLDWTDEDGALDNNENPVFGESSEESSDTGNMKTYIVVDMVEESDPDISDKTKNTYGICSSAETFDSKSITIEDQNASLLTPKKSQSVLSGIDDSGMTIIDECEITPEKLCKDSNQDTTPVQCKDAGSGRKTSLMKILENKYDIKPCPVSLKEMIDIPEKDALRIEEENLLANSPKEPCTSVEFVSKQLSNDQSDKNKAVKCESPKDEIVKDTNKCGKIPSLSKHIKNIEKTISENEQILPPSALQQEHVQGSKPIQENKEATPEFVDEQVMIYGNRVSSNTITPVEKLASEERILTEYEKEIDNIDKVNKLQETHDDVVTEEGNETDVGDKKECEENDMRTIEANVEHSDTIKSDIDCNSGKDIYKQQGNKCQHKQVAESSSVVEENVVLNRVYLEGSTKGSFEQEPVEDHSENFKAIGSKQFKDLQTTEEKNSNELVVDSDMVQNAQDTGEIEENISEVERDPAYLDTEREIYSDDIFITGKNENEINKTSIEMDATDSTKREIFARQYEIFVGSCAQESFEPHINLTDSDKIPNLLCYAENNVQILSEEDDEALLVSKQSNAESSHERKLANELAAFYKAIEEESQEEHSSKKVKESSQNDTEDRMKLDIVPDIGDSLVTGENIITSGAVISCSLNNIDKSESCENSNLSCEQPENELIVVSSDTNNSSGLPVKTDEKQQLTFPPVDDDDSTASTWVYPLSEIDKDCTSRSSLYLSQLDDNAVFNIQEMNIDLENNISKNAEYKNNEMETGDMESVKECLHVNDHSAKHREDIESKTETCSSSGSSDIIDVVTDFRPTGLQQLQTVKESVPSVEKQDVESNEHLVSHRKRQGTEEELAPPGDCHGYSGSSGRTSVSSFEKQDVGSKEHLVSDNKGHQTKEELNPPGEDSHRYYGSFGHYTNPVLNQYMPPSPMYGPWFRPSMPMWHPPPFWHPEHHGPRLPYIYGNERYFFHGFQRPQPPRSPWNYPGVPLYSAPNRSPSQPRLYSPTLMNYLINGGSQTSTTSSSPSSSGASDTSSFLPHDINSPSALEMAPWMISPDITAPYFQNNNNDTYFVTELMFTKKSEKAEEPTTDTTSVQEVVRPVETLENIAADVSICLYEAIENLITGDNGISCQNDKLISTDNDKAVCQTELLLNEILELVVLKDHKYSDQSRTVELTDSNKTSCPIDKAGSEFSCPNIHLDCKSDEDCVSLKLQNGYVVLKQVTSSKTKSSKVVMSENHSVPMVKNNVEETIRRRKLHSVGSCLARLKHSGVDRRDVESNESLENEPKPSVTNTNGDKENKIELEMHFDEESSESTSLIRNNAESVTYESAQCLSENKITVIESMKGYKTNCNSVCLKSEGTLDISQNLTDSPKNDLHQIQTDSSCVGEKISIQTDASETEPNVDLKDLLLDIDQVVSSEMPEETCTNFVENKGCDNDTNKDLLDQGCNDVNISRDIDVFTGRDTKEDSSDWGCNNMNTSRDIVMLQNHSVPLMKNNIEEIIRSGKLHSVGSCLAMYSGVDRRDVESDESLENEPKPSVTNIDDGENTIKLEMHFDEESSESRSSKNNNAECVTFESTKHMSENMLPVSEITNIISTCLKPGGTLDVSKSSTEPINDFQQNLTVGVNIRIITATNVTELPVDLNSLLSVLQQDAGKNVLSSQMPEESCTKFVENKTCDHGAKKDSLYQECNDVNIGQDSSVKADTGKCTDKGSLDSFLSPSGHMAGDKDGLRYLMSAYCDDGDSISSNESAELNNYTSLKSKTECPRKSSKLHDVIIEQTFQCKWTEQEKSHFEEKDNTMILDDEMKHRKTGIDAGRGMADQITDVAQTLDKDWTRQGKNQAHRLKENEKVLSLKAMVKVHKQMSRSAGRSDLMELSKKNDRKDQYLIRNDRKQREIERNQNTSEKVKNKKRKEVLKRTNPKEHLKLTPNETKEGKRKFGMMKSVIRLDQEQIESREDFEQKSNVYKTFEALIEIDKMAYTSRWLDSNLAKKSKQVEERFSKSHEDTEKFADQNFESDSSLPEELGETVSAGLLNQKRKHYDRNYRNPDFNTSLLSSKSTKTVISHDGKLTTAKEVPHGQKDNCTRVEQLKDTISCSSDNRSHRESRTCPPARRTRYCTYSEDSRERTPSYNSSRSLNSSSRHRKNSDRGRSTSPRHSRGYFRERSASVSRYSDSRKCGSFNPYSERHRPAVTPVLNGYSASISVYSSKTSSTSSSSSRRRTKSTSSSSCSLKIQPGSATPLFSGNKSSMSLCNSRPSPNSSRRKRPKSSSESSRSSSTSSRRSRTRSSSGSSRSSPTSSRRSRTKSSSGSSRSSPTSSRKSRTKSSSGSSRSSPTSSRRSRTKSSSGSSRSSPTSSRRSRTKTSSGSSRSSSTSSRRSRTKRSSESSRSSSTSSRRSRTKSSSESSRSSSTFSRRSRTKSSSGSSRSSSTSSGRNKTKSFSGTLKSRRKHYQSSSRYSKESGEYCSSSSLMSHHSSIKRFTSKTSEHVIDNAERRNIRPKGYSDETVGKYPNHAFDKSCVKKTGNQLVGSYRFKRGTIGRALQDIFKQNQQEIDKVKQKVVAPRVQDLTNGKRLVNYDEDSEDERLQSRLDRAYIGTICQDIIENNCKLHAGNETEIPKANAEQQKKFKRVLVTQAMLRSFTSAGFAKFLVTLDHFSSGHIQFRVALLTSQISELRQSDREMIEEKVKRCTNLDIVSSTTSLDSYILTELRNPRVKEIYVLSDSLSDEENVRSLIRYCSLEKFLRQHLTEK